MARGGHRVEGGLRPLTAKALRRTVGATDLWSHRAGLRSTDDLRLPDFLGIGAQKAGSTWLHRNLSCHPELFLPEAKELHYFDWFRVPTLAAYASRFRAAGDRRAGEITPGYSALSDRRVHAVRDVMPRVRVLLLLRDPVDRAWSQLRMDLARKQGRRADEITAAEADARLRQRGARRRSEIAGTVARWSDAFGDQLFLGAYDDISADPEGLLRSVFLHLEVDPDVDLEGWPVEQRFNAGDDETPPTPVMDVLVDRLGSQRDELRPYVPAIVARWDAAGGGSVDGTP